MRFSCHPLALLLDRIRQVAKALNADMILVANGGLGSAYDELELNRGICEKYGIKVRGVVLNKVSYPIHAFASP